MATVIITAATALPGGSLVQISATVDGVAQSLVVDLASTTVAAIPSLLLAQKTRATTIANAVAVIQSEIGTPITVT